ncbi:MAG: PLP-dependent aminotransferase family protein [Mesorhizobium sp.]|uniref:MocR-like ectoine utilization transcription factor EhuR n=1 Tax=Mesorhizobium sp. TaxID=1871066 RepID=UPI000FE4BAC1|nr:PLP-dependent aminotransferase family protein [Mesorhizobium sp.]RWA88126.1 MAG: PLP-dependent aminotransferase family protein [Mesorhizobium sp.]TIU35766.1 MAG: PLP-dependent aminotransferase family protein [Mesorhizobium sp.]
MTMWIPAKAELDRPYFASLAEKIVEAISRGDLKPGEQLPPQRQLAYRIGVSLPTVTRAYEELARRGLTAGETGRGTFIRDVKANPEAVAPYVPERPHGVIDLSIMKPVCEVIHLDRMKDSLAALAVDISPSIVLGSRPSALFARHRSVAKEWLKLCGVCTDDKTIHLTNGGTPALTIALMTVCQPGSTIATEATGLHIVLPLASYLGLKVRGVEIDENGIIPEALERCCQEDDIRALFMLPNALAPTAFVMNENRRIEIVEIARRRELHIIEDDALGPLVAEKPPTFQALAPERTIYITSFTKAVMPSLRTGYLVAPERLLLAVENRLLVTNWSATPLIAEIATRWVQDGTCHELVEWQRDAIAQRHRLVAKVLEGVQYSSHPQSLHIWLTLGEKFSEDEIVMHARRQGVAVARGAAFAISKWQPAVRISVGSTTEEELHRGLVVIHNLLHSEPEPILFGI